MVCDSQKAAVSDCFSNVQIIQQRQEKKNLIPIFSFIHWVPFTKDTVLHYTAHIRFHEVSTCPGF